MSPDPLPPDRSAAGDATRRTFLATERTFLAWFRSGLAALALAITIGRVVPELAGGDQLVFRIIGLGFGLIALGVFAYGFVREHQVVRALERGSFAPFPLTAVAIMTGTVIVLAVVLIALIWV